MTLVVNNVRQRSFQDGCSTRHYFVANLLDSDEEIAFALDSYCELANSMQYWALHYNPALNLYDTFSSLIRRITADRIQPRFPRTLASPSYLCSSVEFHNARQQAAYLRHNREYNGYDTLIKIVKSEETLEQLIQEDTTAMLTQAAELLNNALLINNQRR